MKYFFILFLFVYVYSVQAQEKTYKMAFYNTENLFDTENDTTINDEEFLPEGANAWTQERYQLKLENLSKVISQIGSEKTKTAPSIVGLSEVENKRVVEDLVKTPLLAPFGYKIVHYDSPDRRGVDVALIYNPAHFTVTSSRAVRLVMKDNPELRTRDQLVVSGLLDGEPLHVIVNHWPSRSGGEKKSFPNRVAAAQLCRSIADSILAIDPKAKIIMMGDLNDNPTDESLVKHLRAKGDIDKLTKDEFFNPMFNMFKKDGIGSNAYRDSWSLFDQIILTPGLLDKDYSTYKYYKALIFNMPFLMQKDGAFKGYPFRTFVGNQFQGGYSDHFPAYVYLIKEKK
jgi:hypothetical protein